MFKKILFALIFACTFAQPMLVGNPSSPSLFKEGIFFNNKNYYLRAGYYFDNIYKSVFLDEMPAEGSTDTFFKLRSYGAIVTVNILNILDVYTLLGVSKNQIDNQVFSNDRFSWGVGTKIIFYKFNNIDLALDGKYFRAKHNVDNFIMEDSVFPIVTPHYGFLYEEFQAALCASYKIDIFIPYVGATYLFSTLKPYPAHIGLLRYPSPNQDILNDFKTQDTKNKNKWGAVVGISLVSKETMSINLESRMVDQNAVNVTAEIRF
jgi:hypothetical protein